MADDIQCSKVPTKDAGQLSEDAWSRINEAMHNGVMFLPGGREVVLTGPDIVKLAQWLATIKAKRPKPVSKIEDFLPKETKK